MSLHHVPSEKNKAEILTNPLEIEALIMQRDEFTKTPNENKIDLES